MRSQTRDLRIGKQTGRGSHLPIAVSGEIRAGESLSASLLAAARSLGLRFQDGDILVVKHKIVSKAEGALVALDEIRPRLRRESGPGATGSTLAS
jgi:F420-0:gamma-glutamyl ligase